MTHSPAIVARDLTRKFGHLLAVDHVSLEINQGEIFGFLGPNGSGKSTTIRMLCGLLHPSAGSVRILGQELPAGVERIRAVSGYMTQRFSLYEDLTVAENLDFISRIYLRQREKRQTAISVSLERYQLAGIRRQRTATLSGGQKQRLALAAVTLHEPELLLLDEPTSAVDPQSRREFWTDLFRLAATGTTILVSTHYMDEAERCHRLAIMDHGRIAATGTPQHLMDHIDATVIRAETADPAAAFTVLSKPDWVRSITQLGNRLHILVESDLHDPCSALESLLSDAGLTARLTRTGATLEDVFVAATGFRKG